MSCFYRCRERCLQGSCAICGAVPTSGLAQAAALGPRQTQWADAALESRALMAAGTEPATFGNCLADWPSLQLRAPLLSAATYRTHRWRGRVHSTSEAFMRSCQSWEQSPIEKRACPAESAPRSPPHFRSIPRSKPSEHPVDLHQ